jgi:hypothetical protein
MIDRRVSAAVSEVSDCATSPLVDNISAIVVASDFVRETMWTPPFSAKVGNNKNLATMDGERPRVCEDRLAFGGSDVPPNFWFFIRGVKTP